MADNLLPSAVFFITTYLLHSTLLLGGAWLTIAIIRRLRRSRRRAGENHFFVERVWRLAAIGGLLTACFQVFGPMSRPVFTVPLTSASSEAATLRPSKPISIARSEPRRRIRLPESTSRLDFDTWKSPSPHREHGFNAELNRLSASRERERSSTAAAAATKPKRIHSTSPAKDRANAFSFWLSRLQTFIDRFTGRSPVADCLVVTCVLVLGMGMLRIVVQSRSFSRRLGKCRPLAGRPRALLDELLARADVTRKVELLSSPDYVEPVAFGIVRWRIVLPTGIEARLEEDDLEAILAHELAHLVRGDPRWLFAGRVLCSCFVFQPLNFLARAKWRRAAEFQCDEWAVRHGINRLTMARCLTLAAEFRSRRPACSSSLAVGGGRQTHLAERVEHLVDDSERASMASRSLGARCVSLFLLAALVAFAVFAPAFDQTQQTAFASKSKDVFRLAEKSPRIRSQHRPVGEPSSVVDGLRALENELAQVEYDLKQLSQELNESTTTEQFEDILNQVAARTAHVKQLRAILKTLSTNPLSARGTR